MEATDDHVARSARASQRKEDYRFLTGAGQYTDDVDAAAPDLRRLPALAARARDDQAASTSTRRKAAPGVSRVYHRRRPRGREGRRPALRLADHRRQRPADEGAAASRRSRRARCATSATASRWSSPRRSTQAKDAAELIEVDYEVLPAVVDARQGAQAARRRCTTIAPDNTCYVWALGDKARGRRGVRQGRARHQARVRQQPPDPQRDRAARGERALHRAPTTATRSTSRTRTRTSSGC